MSISYEEALGSTLEYFNGDELAASVFTDKYILRDNDSNILEKNPHDRHVTIAQELARIESKKFKNPYSFEFIFSYLDKFKKIVPQGSPLAAIGNKFQYMTLSNCYVLDPPVDSYGGIHKTDEQLSHISKRRGGTGIDLSHLRPDGAFTRNAARTSTGIIPFAERYSNSIREVGQNGRRGALMLTLSVHHPEVLAFAKSKLDETKITGANISIRLTDEFLTAVENDEQYEQRWPVDSKTPKISRMVSAREVWKEIIKCAHKRAEPGLLFWDTIISESPADCYAKFGYKTVCTNPCSELPLSILDSCRLFLLNLFGYVKNAFNNGQFDFDEFYKDCMVLQRLMDDVVDLELECIDKIIDKVKNDPEEESVKVNELDLWTRIRKACANGRRTGSGITALGDVIAAVGLKYGSDESIEFVDKIYKTLKLACYRSSVEMAKELGPFAVWDYELEKDNPFLNRIKDEDPALYEDMKKYGRRNISLLTTAPAGSVSLLTQTTSGIEPLYKMSYIRRKKINPSDTHYKVDFVDKSGDSWQEFKVYHPKLQMWMDVTGETDETKSPYYGCCAEDIDWKQRVILQSVAHKHVDHSISSTINLPEDVSEEKVAEIYETAWRYKCKGITVYRKNCRTGVLVDEKAEDVRSSKITKTSAPLRPKTLPCDVHHTSVKGKEYFVLVGLLEGEPFEVFAGENGHIPNKIKKGTLEKVKRGQYKAFLDENHSIDSITEYCNDDEEALTRLTSTSLRHGADVSFVVHQLEKVKGPMNSFAKSMSRALKKYIQDGTKVFGETCINCGSTEVTRQEGCITCMNCGNSKCS